MRDINKRKKLYALHAYLLFFLLLCLFQFILPCNIFLNMFQHRCILKNDTYEKICIYTKDNCIIIDNINDINVQYLIYTRI